MPLTGVFNRVGEDIVAIPKRSIMHALPQTKQNDPRKFPEYEFRGYPKMMTKIEDGKHVAYKKRNGKPVIVQNETEHKEFLKSIGKGEPDEPAKTLDVGGEDAGGEQIESNDGEQPVEQQNVTQPAAQPSPGKTIADKNKNKKAGR